MKKLLSAAWNHPEVQKRPVVKEFVKFSMVGVVNTMTSAGLYLVATRLVGLHPLWANAAAFVMAVTVSFILNKRWTFRDQGQNHLQQYSRFFLVSLIGFGLSELIIWWVHVRLGIHDLIAFGLAVVIVLFWNFLVNRWWTFRQRHSAVITTLPK